MKKIVFLILGATLCFAACFVYDLIVRDQGGPIFATSSPKAMSDMISVFTDGGLPAQVWLPSFTKGNSKELLVDRAGMRGGVLINYTSPAFRRSAVADAVVGYQYVTCTPHADAALTAENLRNSGYKVELVRDPDPAIAPGKMAFVRVIGLLYDDQPIVLVYRRHKFFMGGGKPASYSQHPDPANLKFAQ